MKTRLEKINIATSKAVCFLRIRTPLCKIPGSEIYHGDGASFGHMPLVELETIW